MTDKEVAEDAVNGKPFLLSVSGASPSFKRDSFISTHKTLQEARAARSAWEKKNPGEIGYASRASDVPELRSLIMKLLDGKTASVNAKIAKELLKVAKALMAYTPKVGDIGNLSYPIAKKAEWATPRWIRQLGEEWNTSSGWVKVIKVDGDKITVIPRYGNPIHDLTGGIQVPLKSLNFSIPKYENAKALTKALGVGEDFVNTFVSKYEYPVLLGDPVWLNLKQEMKIDREMYDNSDDRFRGPEM
jgi:hypothetical protein